MKPSRKKRTKAKKQKVHFATSVTDDTYLEDAPNWFGPRSFCDASVTVGELPPKIDYEKFSKATLISMLKDLEND